MRCEEARERVPGYVSGELSGAEISALDDHLDRCDACTAAVDARQAAHGSKEPAAGELLRLMRVPVTSAGEARAGAESVLRALGRTPATESATAVAPPGAAEPLRDLRRSWRARLLGSPWRGTREAGRRGWGLAAAVVIVGLAAFAWQRQGQYRTLGRHVAVLAARQQALQQENAALRRQVTANSTQPPPPRPPTALQQEAIRLRRENEQLKRQLARAATPPGALATLRDGAQRATVGRDGSVRMARVTALPASLAEPVRQLVVDGVVTPARPVAVALAILKEEATRSALRGAREAGKPVPVPLGPLLTGVRTPRPPLRWIAVPGAQEYRVRVAYPEEKESGRVVWEGSARTETQVVLPAGALRRGEVFFWQVEARVGEETRLAPAVGFWVLGGPTLRAVEAAERQYPGSALLRAVVYEQQGLYEEARAQLERLAAANPGSASVQAMRDRLERRVGGGKADQP